MRPQTMVKPENRLAPLMLTLAISQMRLNSLRPSILIPSANGYTRSGIHWARPAATRARISTGVDNPNGNECERCYTAPSTA